MVGAALGRASLVSLPDDGPGMLGDVLRALALNASSQRGEPRHAACSTATWESVERSAGLEGPSSADAFASLFGVPVYLDDDLELGVWEIRPGDRPDEASS